MSTINGTGTKYYSWQPLRAPERTGYATKWFTLLYVPVLPLRRQKLKVLTDRANEGFFDGAVDHYQILQETPIVWGEVFATWWAFWRGLLTVIVPFLVFFAVSQYQNARRAQGRPHDPVLGTVAAACLFFSLGAAIVIPLRALRRSRG